jgi:outer membrane immunogenic protein
MSNAKNFAAAAVCGAASMLFAASAAAQDGASRPGVYVSGGVTSHTFEGDNGVDTDATALTARAGVQVNRWLSFEADASFGLDDGNFDFQGNEGDFSLDDNSDGDVADVINAPGDFGLNYLIGGYVRGSLPVSDQFEVSARVGYAFADVDSTVTTPGGATIDIGDSESGASYGVGASYSITDRQAVRFDYTFTDFDLAEDSSVGLMYQFKF